MQLNVQKIETIIQKINFLYKSIKKGDDVSQNLEIALLKQYAINLYDAILESEHNLPSMPVISVKDKLETDLSHTSLLAVEKLKIADEKPEMQDVNFSEPVITTKENIVEKIIETPLKKVEEISKKFDQNPTDEIEHFDDPLIEDEKPTGIKIIGDVEVESNDEIEAENIITKTSNWLNDIKEEAKETIDDSKTEVLSKFSYLNDDVNDNFDAVEQKVEEFSEKPKLELNDLIAQNKNEESSLGDRLGKNLKSNDFDISVNERYAFIRELFKGDEEAYENTLNELSNCSNVIEAFTYINLNVKMAYKWDDENPTTRTFQEVVKKKFLDA